MKKQVRVAFLVCFLSSLGVAQDSTSLKVAIPLVASDSHQQSTDVAVESLEIVDQNARVASPSLLRGAELPVELGILIDGIG